MRRNGALVKIYGTVNFLEELTKSISLKKVIQQWNYDSLCKPFTLTLTGH